MSGRGRRKAVKAAPEPVTAVLPSVAKRGSFSIGEDVYEAVLLNDGLRLVVGPACVRMLTEAEDVDLATILSVPAVARRFGPEVAEAIVVHYADGQAGGVSSGMTAEMVHRAMCAYAEGNEDGRTPLTVRQRARGRRCRRIIDVVDVAWLESALVSAVGTVAPGRVQEAVPEVARRKIIPEAFWAELSRMRGRSPEKTGTPMWWGKLVNWLIYDTLDDEVLDRLGELRGLHGNKWYQMAYDDPAVDAFRRRAEDVTDIAKECRDVIDLRERVAVAFGHGACQMPLMPLF